MCNFRCVFQFFVTYFKAGITYNMTTLENLGQSRWNFPLAILSWRQFWQAEPKLQSALRTMVCTFALGTMIYNAKKTCRNSLILLYQVSSFDFWILTLLVKTHNQKNLPSILSLILNNYSIKPKMNVFTENATIWWLLWWCNFSLISSLFRIYICQKFLKTFRFQL